MSKLRLNWGAWFYGSFGAIIGGGSSAVTGSLTAIGLTPEQYNLGAGFTRTLKMFAACFIINGVVSLCLWLKQKPVPDIETDEAK